VQTKQKTKQVILWVGDIAFDTYEKLDPKIRSRFDHEIVLFEKQGNSKACKSIVYIKNKEQPNLNYNIDELQFHHALFLEKRETKYHLIVGSTLELLFVSFLESIKKQAKKRFTGTPLINCYKRKSFKADESILFLNTPVAFKDIEKEMNDAAIWYGKQFNKTWLMGHELEKINGFFQQILASEQSKILSNSKLIYS
jgi:hypothetical protein